MTFTTLTDDEESRTLGDLSGLLERGAQMRTSQGAGYQAILVLEMIGALEKRKLVAEGLVISLHTPVPAEQDDLKLALQVFRSDSACGSLVLAA
jgi:hypothetical protein